MTIEVKSRHEQDTERIGRQVAQIAAAGDVMALFGPLGAGKTAFIRGFAQGLGVSGRVTSPTYAIVHEYQGNIPVFHFDLYRIESSEELYEIGWEEYLERKGVCLVEWAERIEEILPSTAYKIHFVVIRETERVIRIEGGPHEDSRD